jgi:hypothetical protein
VNAIWARLPFIKSPAEGAKTSIYLASDAAVAGVSGKYYDNCRCVCVWGGGVGGGDAYGDTPVRRWRDQKNLHPQPLGHP